jgi:hypothetical protein
MRECFSKSEHGCAEFEREKGSQECLYHSSLARWICVKQQERAADTLPMTRWLVKIDWLRRKNDIFSEPTVENSKSEDQPKIS